MKVYVMSQYLFNDFCIENKFCDNNIEDNQNVAFISIVGTKGNDDSSHFFRNDHLNVLNLEFDDVLQDGVLFGHKYKAISSDQADQIVAFIEANKDKDFYVHCLAGISRSGAIGTFISEYCGHDLVASGLHPNIEVLSKLRRASIFKEWFNLI